MDATTAAELSLSVQNSCAASLVRKCPDGSAMNYERCARNYHRRRLSVIVGQYRMSIAGFHLKWPCHHSDGGRKMIVEVARGGATAVARTKGQANARLHWPLAPRATGSAPKREESPCSKRVSDLRDG